VEKTVFSREKLIRFLDRLEGSTGHYLTVYIKPSSFPGYVTEFPARFGPFAGELAEALTGEDVSRQAQLYETGAVIFWSETENRSIILPPFPVLEDGVFTGRPEVTPIHQLLEKERTLGLVLVTWGWYAVGVAGGGVILEYKKGTGHIHKRHKKGGSSSKRFARRIEEQKNEFLRRVAYRVEEKLRGHRMEQIFFGGNRLILKPLLEECPYLKSEADKLSKRFFNVRYADMEALSGSLENANASLVFNY